MWYIHRVQACFGECSQWGYWTRLTSVEGCSAAPGVRVSHSPHRLSTRLLTVAQAALYLRCLSGVSSTRFWAARNRRLFVFPLLPCRFLLPLLCVRFSAAWRIFFFGGDQAVLRGFFAVEDG